MDKNKIVTEFRNARLNEIYATIRYRKARANVIQVFNGEDRLVVDDIILERKTMNVKKKVQEEKTFPIIKIKTGGEEFDKARDSLSKK